MRRNLAMRVCAAFVAAWFGFITIQPLYADPCPHHQPALAAIAHAASAQSGSATRQESQTSMLGGMAMGDGQAMQGSSGNDTPASHACHCIGVWCGTAAVAMAQSPVAWALIPVAQHRAAPPTAPAVRSAHNDAPHSRPFSTAPPFAELA
jgi:hypothetical protein